METPKWVRSELHCKMFEIFSTGTLPKCEEIFDRSRVLTSSLMLEFVEQFWRIDSRCKAVYDKITNLQKTR